MKLGQLEECSMKNFFLEKSSTKCGGTFSPRSFFFTKIELGVSGTNLFDSSFV